MTALASLSLLFSQVAEAQVVDDGTRNAARSLASQGKEAFDHADFERARDLFHRAYTLVPAPTIVLYEARSLLKLRRLVEAEEAFMRAARTSLDAESPAPFRRAVQEAEEALTPLRERMPRVTIVTSGSGARDPGLSVTMDGHPLKSALLGVELPIDPGDHALSAVVPGGRPVQVAFSIVEKQRSRVELAVPTASKAAIATSRTPAAPPPRNSEPKAASQAASSPAFQARAGLIIGGIGLAGLTTGIVTGLMASSRYSTAESECPEHACVEGSAGWDTVQSFRALRTVSTIGYVVGGLGLAGGTTLYLMAPSKSKSSARGPSMNVWVSANSAGVLGVF